jgi:hypothetical protein
MHARKPGLHFKHSDSVEVDKMHGTLDIRRNTDLASTSEIYQVRYEDLAGESFAASMDKDDLHDLLYHKLAMKLTNEDLDRAYERATRDGHVTFPEIEMRENELAGAGLRYLAPEG